MKLKCWRNANFILLLLLKLNFTRCGSHEIRGVVLVILFSLYSVVIVFFVCNISSERKKKLPERENTLSFRER